MKILVLEDNEERRVFFKKALFGTETDYVVDANSCIEKINTVKYDLLFLDHDLGGKVFVNPHEENTGYQVALALKNSLNKKTPVIIHSWNRPASIKMNYEIGKHAVWIPFGFINFKQLLKEPK